MSNDERIVASLRGHRLGVLLSHPIQYVSPWLRQLAAVLDLKVYYGHRQTALEQGRAGFAHDFDWDVPLLEGYEYEWLPNVSRNPGVGGFFACDTPNIGAILARDRIDWLITFGWRQWCCWQAVRACRRAGIKVLARGDSNLESPRGLWKRCVKRMLYPTLLGLFDAHLYVGAANRRYLEHYGVGPERLFYVPHAVDTEWFAERARAARESGRCQQIRDSFRIGAHAHVYLFVGKLIASKRVGDFLNAFALLRRTAPELDVHAVVVGDGPQLGALGEQAAAMTDRVHFAGFRNQSELPAWYAAADTLVVPGPESWGLVVNEAAACGVPALAGEFAACRHDMLDGGLAGDVFRVEDPPHLAGKLKRMHRLMRERRIEVQAELRRVSQRHGLDAATRGLLGALSTLHRQAPPPAEICPAPAANGTPRAPSRSGSTT